MFSSAKVYEFFKDLVKPTDVCGVCEDAFADDPEKLRKCRSDCEQNDLGTLHVECANPWYEVFQDRSKTVCMDGNVFVLHMIIMYLSIIVAMML